MTDRPPLRRPEFDSITMGWGADDAADLGARLEMVKELKNKGCLTSAEQKIETAMQGRLAALVS